MYRLYQANKNPRHDGGDDAAVNPLPAPFYGDSYDENGIPFQVTVQPVGDEPSALGDGSAMAFQREFEELWRSLEQEAIRNGWTHIQPGQFEDAINNLNNMNRLNNNNANSNDDEDDDEDEETEWGINSIPPNIIDPGYGNLGRPNGSANIVEAEAPNVRALINGRPHPAAAAARPPMSATSSNVAGSEAPFSAAASAGVRSGFESSNNETTIHGNHNDAPIHATYNTNRWETDDGTLGPPPGQNRRPDNRKREPQGRREADNMQQAMEEPPLADRAHRLSLNDDPGPQLAQASRWQTPPRAAAETEVWQTLPANLMEDRAKFISAGIIKPSKNMNLGIELKSNRDGAIEIEHIATDGFLFVSGTPLKVGDLITGIKTSKASYTCGHIGGMRKNEIMRLLKRSTGRITIIAENPTGNPERIECMTSKPHPEFGTGIFFLSGSPGSKILQIHSVPSNGLFANSLLHRGAKVISINGVDCTELDACVATDIVKSAPRFVSIVAQAGSSVDYASNAAAHLRSVPESDSSGGGRSSFGIFRRRSGTRSESSDHTPRSVDC